MPSDNSALGVGCPQARGSLQCLCQRWGTVRPRAGLAVLPPSMLREAHTVDAPDGKNMKRVSTVAGCTPLRLGKGLHGCGGKRGIIMPGPRVCCCNLWERRARAENVEDGERAASGNNDTSTHGVICTVLRDTPASRGAGDDGSVVSAENAAQVALSRGGRGDRARARAAAGHRTAHWRRGFVPTTAAH